MITTKSLILLVILQILFPNYTKEKINNNIYNLTIITNGIKVFNINNNDNVVQKQCVYNPIEPSIEKQTLSFLPKDYVFLNYSYEIKNSTLYTFHRDVTSSKTFQRLRYPSYTLIIYFYKGNHLSICDNSHKAKYSIPKPTIVSGNVGQAILFDADIVHASALPNENTNTNTNTHSKITPYTRYCKQYKIAHIHDIEKLSHLQGKHISKTDIPKKISTAKLFIRMLSHKYIFLFDNLFIGSFIERQYNNTIVNLISNILNLDFFNNKIENTK